MPTRSEPGMPSQVPHRPSGAVPKTGSLAGRGTAHDASKSPPRTAESQLVLTYAPSIVNPERGIEASVDGISDSPTPNPCPSPGDSSWNAAAGRVLCVLWATPAGITKTSPAFASSVTPPRGTTKTPGEPPGITAGPRGASGVVGVAELPFSHASPCVLLPRSSERSPAPNRIVARPDSTTIHSCAVGWKCAGCVAPYLYIQATCQPFFLKSVYPATGSTRSKPSLSFPTAGRTLV